MNVAKNMHITNRIVRYLDRNEDVFLAIMPNATNIVLIKARLQPNGRMISLLTNAIPAKPSIKPISSKPSLNNIDNSRRISFAKNNEIKNHESPIAGIPSLTEEPFAQNILHAKSPNSFIGLL